MAHKQIVSILLAALFLAAVSGCQETGRIDRVRSRWERTMDQARLQAAEKSLEAGQPAYAERLLSDCRVETSAEPLLAEQIQQLRTRIRTECYARTDSLPPSPEETPY